MPEATRAAVAGASVDYPADWELLDHAAAALAIAPRDGWSDFRPNIVLTIDDVHASIIDVSEATMRLEQGTIEGTHVVSCDVWPHQGVPARRIQFFYPTEASAVIVTRWVWAADARVLHLTASCLPSQLAGFEPIATWVASSVAVTE